MTFPVGSATNYYNTLKKGSYKRSQILHFANHERQVALERPTAEGKGSEISSSGSPFPFVSSTPLRPQWLALDKMVLHFYAYSHEGTVDRVEECMRIRFCDIYFYLEDETIMVMENHDDRAEMSFGKLLNRQRVPRPNDPLSHMGAYDFNVNKPVIIYSRQYFIYKCDEFTRETMTKMGIEVPADVSPPFSQHALDSAAELQELGPLRHYGTCNTQGLSSFQHGRRSLLQPLKPFQEKHLNHRLRRHISSHHPMERFMNYDTKVLRFFGYWDDRERLFGDRHHFVIHYYLGDQTTEILRKCPKTYGKERLEPFIKRSRLPKSVLDYDKVNLGSPWPLLNIITANSKHPEASHYIYDQALYDTPPEIITDKDFRCGTIIPIMARPVFIYDCDEFTKWYYKETYGYDMQPIVVEERIEKPASRKMPPYNGYGSEQDSLKNCVMLVPKPPLLDVRKYLLLDWEDVDPDKMIFRMRMVTDKVEDKHRTFIMSYCMNNDNIYIYEKEAPQGVTTGSFHSRKSVKKLNDPVTDQPGYLAPEDVYVGGVYMFNGQAFVVTETDEATAKFMEKYPQRFQQADSRNVVDKICRIVTPDANALDRLESAFQMYDPGQSGLVDWNAFINAVRSLADNALTPHEYLTLARRFQTHRDVDRERLRQLFRSLIQHGFRRNTWEPSTNWSRACIKADHTESGFISLLEMVRCAKAVRAPTNCAVLTTYLDLMIDSQRGGISYGEVLRDLDWVNNPARKLSEIPQTGANGDKCTFQSTVFDTVAARDDFAMLKKSEAKVVKKRFAINGAQIGKDFDYNAYFGGIVPIVRYKEFMEDVRKLVSNLKLPH